MARKIKKPLYIAINPDWDEAYHFKDQKALEEWIDDCDIEVNAFVFYKLGNEVSVEVGAVVIKEKK